MSNRQHKFALTALSAAMLTLYQAKVAAADDEAVRQLTTPDSSVTVGVGHWNGDRQQFGIYDDLRGDDTILLLDADIRQRDDATGTWMTGRFRDLGIDTRDLDLRYERQGNWGLGLQYYQIPRVAPYEVNSGVMGLGSENVTIPALIEPGSGDDITLKTERKGVGLKMNKYLAPNLNFRADFKNEDKEGKRHWGFRANAAVGRDSDVVFIAEPIDSTIRQFEAALDYSGKEFQMSGGYYGTWYDNHNSMVTADHPQFGDFYLSLPLDNESHQLFVNGGYNFTPTTRGTFRVAYTHATQDENLPTSAVPGLAWSGAPDSLDGEINTTLVQFGLTARPMDNLSLVAKLRYHDVDEKTPEWLISEDPPVNSTPLDYETTYGMVEGSYRLPAGYSLIAGIEYKTQNRTVPFGSDDNADGFDDQRYVVFRNDLDETLYRLQLRKSLSETLNGSLSYLHSKRDGSDYSDAIHADGGNGEDNGGLINPAHIADRDRDKWRLTLDWMPTNNLGLQFNVEDARDDYGPGSNPNGLTDGKARLYSLDADFVLNENWRLTGWVSYDELETSQVTASPINPRQTDLKDTGRSVGLGIDGRATDKLKVGADFEWTRVEAEYNDDPASDLPLPDIESTATKVGLFAEYAVQKNADVRLDVLYQRWKTDDWSWQFADGSPFIYGTTSDGTRVTQDPKQSATFVGVSYRYRF